MLQLMTGQGFMLTLQRGLTVSGAEIAYSESEDLIDVLVADVHSLINRVESMGGGDVMLSYPMVNDYIRTLVTNGLDGAGVDCVSDEPDEGESVEFGFSLQLNGSLAPGVSSRRLEKIMSSSDGFDVSFELFED